MRQAFAHEVGRQSLPNQAIPTSTMNRLVMFSLLAVLSLAAAESGTTHLVDATVQSRIGYDTNPIASGGQPAAGLGDEGALTFAWGANVGIARPPTSPRSGTFQAAYAVEVVRYDGWESENFSTHRFALDGRLQSGRWKLDGEGSVLFIAGSHDTLASPSSTNAYALTLWRERRRQWQYRAKAQAQADFGLAAVRITGSLLAYDYQTRAVDGKVAFADRSDIQLGVMAGWKQNPDSLFLAGLRGGQEQQAMVPLPNYAFDYGNTYTRVALGWEGRGRGNTTFSILAGPDFRHYSGQIDPVIFLHGRNRTSLWLEGSLTTKPTKALILTAKATRTAWLSSTGRSAYLDTAVETGANLKISSRWSARMSVKLHLSDYYPFVRKDWEALVGAGVTWSPSDKFALTADLLRHRGWNTLDGVAERQFHRTTVSIGASLKH